MIPSNQERRILASWEYSPDTELLAVRKGDDITFEVQSNQGSISELYPKYLKNWIFSFAKAPGLNDRK